MSGGGSSFLIDGDPIKGTFTATTDDEMRTLEQLGVSLSGSGPLPQKAQAVLISVETNAARFAFPGGSGTGHSIASGGSIWIRGYPATQKIRLASATGSSAATLRITPFF